MIFKVRLSHAWIALLAVPLAAALGGCSFSLAEDITPPPGYQPPAAVTAAPVALPLVPPDAQNGAALYAEKCAPCHGSAGMGDGPQSGNLPNPPTALGDPAVARAARPVDWYQVVTNGNLEKFMPPFGSALTDRQRWDVVTYALSLSSTPDQIAAGKGVYTQQCAACHGESGAGEGPQAASLATQPADWTHPAALVERSNQDLVNAILNGQGSAMPAFKGKLSEDQAWAAADYLRTLASRSSAPNALAAAGTAEPSPAVEASAQPPANSEAAASKEHFQVFGRVTNASGGLVPAGLTARLQGYDNIQPVMEANALVRPDASYRFENVAIVPGRVFVVSVEYKGNTFYSDLIQAADVTTGQEAQLPVSIYEATTDTSRLVADRMHLFFEFSDPNTLKVVELFIISNPGNQVVTAAQPGGAVLTFALPQEATDLQFENGALGQRFIQSANGFGDTQSILPGSGQQQVLFGYKIPYDGKTTVKISLPLPVSAVVAAVTSTGNVRLQSSQLRDAGQRVVQNQTMELFGGNDFPAGSTLEMTLSGRPSSGPNINPGTLPGLLLGIGTFAAVVVLGILVLRRSRPETSGAQVYAAPEQPASVDGLLDEIVALDDLHRTGRLAQDVYQRRRAELKGKLRKRVEGSE